MNSFSSQGLPVGTTTVDPDNDTIKYVCPSCESFSYSTLSTLGCRFRLQMTCSCGAHFLVEINLRDTQRKKVSIPATLIKFSSPPFDHRIRQGTPETSQTGRPNGRIVDLSRQGAGVMNFDSSHIRTGDHICISFQLKEASSSTIEQHYQVVNITNNRLGCIMVGSNPLLENFIAN